MGPGPFTGLRSGIATARTLAFVWDKPLYGLMSLDAVALEVAESTDAAPEFLVATDARRKEVYWARYTLAEGQLPQLVDGPHVGFAADLPDLPVYGAGAGLYADVLQGGPGFSSRTAGRPVPGPVRAGPARRGRAAAGLHARCTCANPTPRCPGPGSGRCEHAGRHRSSSAGRRGLPRT